jgi:hypothetical protein
VIRAPDAADSRFATESGPAGPGAALVFAAEMYGLQLDQLAALLAVADRRASAIAARWVRDGLAETGRLGPGGRWVWLTKAGLASCGLAYTPAAPALSRLAHIRAVTAVRLALEAAPGYAAGGAWWRGERRIRARLGGRLGGREHLPDGEVHWPEFPASAEIAPAEAAPSGAGLNAAGLNAAGLSGAAPAWAGECWAIEVELTPKTVARTAAIMHELLTRTGDYGGPAGEAAVPGLPTRHHRVLYLCSPAAARTVARARAGLDTASAARVEIRAVPPAALLPAPGAPRQAGRA